jgi:Flp pilus assembly protein TadG
MTPSLFPNSLIQRAYRHGIRKAGENEDGVSTIEFALIAPFLLLLYFGGVELSLLMLADRQITSTSATMGDLTSRLLTFSDQDRTNVFAASEALLSTVSPDEAQLRVSSLVNNGGNITVEWSEANDNATPLSIGATVADLPLGIVPDGGTIIMTETEFNYISELGFFLQGQRTLKDRFFLRPRRTNAIQRIKENS